MTSSCGPAGDAGEISGYGGISEIDSSLLMSLEMAVGNHQEYTHIQLDSVASEVVPHSCNSCRVFLSQLLDDLSLLAQDTGRSWVCFKTFNLFKSRIFSGVFPK